MDVHRCAEREKGSGHGGVEVVVPCRYLGLRYRASNLIRVVIIVTNVGETGILGASLEGLLAVELLGLGLCPMELRCT